MGNDTDIYIVEELMKKRQRKGKTEYLVKWVGWSDSHNSWEPKPNILDKNLIADFEAEWQSKNKNPASKENPSSSVEKYHHHKVNNLQISTQESSITTGANSTPSRTNTSSISSSASETDLSSANYRKRKFQIEETPPEKGVKLSSSSNFTFPNSNSISPDQFPNEVDAIEIGQKDTSKRSSRKIPGAAKRSRVYPSSLNQKSVSVTEVTAQNLTVIIAESPTPEGFFENYPQTN